MLGNRLNARLLDGIPVLGVCRRAVQETNKSTAYKSSVKASFVRRRRGYVRTGAICQADE